MSTLPKISICIPAYNSGGFIAPAIESVLAQTFSDWELVIVDDRSHDQTFAVASSYKDHRIRAVQNDVNIGAQGNWNRAADECRGAFSKILCHDDVLYPDCLQQQYDVLTNPAHQNVGMVTSHRDIIDETGRSLIRNRGFGGRRRVVSGRAALRRVVRSGTNPLGEPAAVMFRTELCRLCGGFSGRSLYMIDVDLWCRMLQRTNLFVIPRSLCAFRISRNSLSTTLARSQTREARRFFNQLKASAPGVATGTDYAIGAVRTHFLGVGRRIIYTLARPATPATLDPAAPASPVVSPEAEPLMDEQGEPRDCEKPREARSN